MLVGVSFLNVLLPKSRKFNKSNAPTMARICRHGHLPLGNMHCWNRICWNIHFLSSRAQPRGTCSELYRASSLPIRSQRYPQCDPSTIWLIILNNYGEYVTIYCWFSALIPWKNCLFEHILPLGNKLCFRFDATFKNIDTLVCWTEEE